MQGSGKEGCPRPSGVSVLALRAAYSDLSPRSWLRIVYPRMLQVREGNYNAEPTLAASTVLVDAFYVLTERVTFAGIAMRSVTHDDDPMVDEDAGNSESAFSRKEFMCLECTIFPS